MEELFLITSTEHTSSGAHPASYSLYSIGLLLWE